jgi:phytoene dehydrogenase-like protein
MPSVIGNIVYTELSTPVTTRHFMNYGHGEIYGLASRPERFAIRCLGARTPIRGLYLAGTGRVHSGRGRRTVWWHHQRFSRAGEEPAVSGFVKSDISFL